MTIINAQKVKPSELPVLQLMQLLLVILLYSPCTLVESVESVPLPSCFYLRPSPLFELLLASIGLTGPVQEH